MGQCSKVLFLRLSEPEEPVVWETKKTHGGAGKRASGSPFSVVVLLCEAQALCCELFNSTSLNGKIHQNVSTT